ncbi:MAG TPA: cation-translocating P-type ATPase [Vicinamibacterales bacterium]|nr:cation-translocating P-type ATPase [Vicinamibacterales bacterium]
MSVQVPAADACCDHCVVEPPRSTAARARGALAALAASLLAVGCLADLLWATPTWAGPLFLLAAGAGIVFPARRAWEALRGRRLDINALMVVAVAGAVLIGEWEEAAMVVFLFAVAQWLEARSVARARAAIATLLDLAPPEARIEEAGGVRLVALDRVAPGDTMRVRPGDRVPLDGRVVEGRSDVNQAPITGESIPVEKTVGDEVYAGTINGHGSLRVTVTRHRDDSMLARIIHLVEHAQSERAPIQHFIDRFAAWYTPSVVILAALVGVVPILAGLPAETWVYRALVVLVVACPCALVISTPVSMVSALAGAARHGVLIKGGASLERLAAITTLAFDKTGTLTSGEVAVGATDACGGLVDERELLRLAAAVEQYSEHPVARAIVSEALARELALPPAGAVRALPGLGVEGMVDGAEVLCAAPRYFRDRQRLDPLIADRAARIVMAGMSPVVVARAGRVLGLVGVADRERASAPGVVAELRRTGVARVAMLTGDHEATARAVGARVGVDDVRAELLPVDKVSAIAELRGAGTVAMVGDGINDAPALAAADVGIVMGAVGSAAAIETADVALMTDDLSRIPYAIRLGRATVRNVHANVVIALVLKAAFVVAAASGVATLWMAVLADTGASVIVLANALRLRRFR